MALLPNLAASRLPTLSQAATLQNAQTLGNPQGGRGIGELAQLLGKYQQAQQGLERAGDLSDAEYINNSGTLGLVAALANKYMGGRLRRKSGESATELTQRILAAEREAKNAEALAAENKAAEKERAQIAQRLAAYRANDPAMIAALGLDQLPQGQKQEYDLVETEDGWSYLPRPTGPTAQQQQPQDPRIGDDVLPALEFEDLRARVEQAESAGNPNAVSPKGAVGRMQTMPGTLADPGYGVVPARDQSDAERTRVGTDYLQAMLQQYVDPRLALAAYNWGPGNVDAAMKRTGGNVGAVLAGAPRETQDYVRKITGGGNAGGVQAIPVSGARRKDKSAGVTRQLSPQEAAAAGYEPGTVVYMTADGTPVIGQRPKAAPPADVKRSRDVATQAAQFDEIESIVKDLEDTNSVSGAFEIPVGPEHEKYKSRASRLAVLLKPLIRGPGEGTWTDSDQALLERLVPRVSNYEETNTEVLGGLRSLLESKRSGLGIRSSTPATNAPSPIGLSAAGAAAYSKYAGGL